MILFVRQAKYRAGKGEAAIKWAREVTKYVNEKFPASELQPYFNRFGSISDIVWIGKAKDLVTLDKLQNDVETDKGYLKLVQQAWDANLLVDASFEDKVLVSID
jgi:hypothetical protein